MNGVLVSVRPSAPLSPGPVPAAAVLLSVVALARFKNTDARRVEKGRHPAQGINQINQSAGLARRLEGPKRKSGAFLGQQSASPSPLH